MFGTPLLTDARLLLLSVIVFPVHLRAVRLLFRILQMTSIEFLKFFFPLFISLPLIREEDNEILPLGCSHPVCFEKARKTQRQDARQ